MLKTWLIQIQNAVISDSFARYEFKNPFSTSIKLFELFFFVGSICPHQTINAIIQPVEKCRRIFEDKSKVKISKYYLSTPL